MLDTVDKAIARNNMIIANRNVSPIFPRDDAFVYTVSCPVCKRRIFDLTNMPGKLLHVRLKCPHCRKIIKIPISAF